MGQQQLILLVLATVIVGLAIVVGIRAFSENSIKANADAMMQDAIRIANDAQAWKQKPETFGGQGTLCAVSPCPVVNFTGATFDRLGYQHTSGTYTNLNGNFTLTAGTTGLLITGVNAELQTEVQVRVCGLTDQRVRGSIMKLGTAAATGTAPAACPT
jgi:hypothetical protein